VRHGRLPWYHPDDLDPDQRQFYEKVVTSPRANAARPTPLVDEEGRLNGPFNAMLTNPTIGDAVQAVGNSLRFSGKLPRSTFEGIVLMVSVDRRAPYEWYAHAPLALRAGLDQEVLTALREGRDDQLRDALSVDVIQLVRDTLAHQQPSEATIRAVEAEHGAAGVTEIVVAVGFYDLIATLMRTWDSPLPEGAEDPFA
jgi:4-carboxymuconolactone decarboxylase